jgi:hypothetical protein
MFRTASCVGDRASLLARLYFLHRTRSIYLLLNFWNLRRAISKLYSLDRLLLGWLKITFDIFFIN